MSVSKLVTALTVTFAVSAVFLVVEFLFILRRRRSSRLRPPQTPISDYSANKLLHLFCLKSQTRVEPTEAPTQNPPGSSPEDPVIDVFKLLEANGSSRILCTIKEDDSEYVESLMSGVESGEVAPETEKVTLKVFLESEAAAEKADVAGEGTKTVVSSPCDSPMFFMPVGSPSREGFMSEVGSPVAGDRCVSGPVNSSYDR